MANIDSAFGLRPYKMLGSGPNTNGMSTYKIQTTGTQGVANAIYQGQPVIPLANGLISYCANANGGTVPILGAFIGCNYTDLLGNTIFDNKYPGTASVKSSTEVTALIADHPDQLFLINCNAGVTQADVFRNANFATAVTGNDNTGISLGELAQGTLNSTNTLNLRIVGLEDSPSNSDTASAGMLAIVQLNNHFYRYNANGTGAGI
jgi:hypothetical protein|tara:strand:+ start:164 stop:781 length:618 start_codon:yes stop_codon:yes gene_type:complete